MNEKKLLQIAISIACIVPISAGLAGMVLGATMLGGGRMEMDSHFRYLSGLLLGIGAGFLTAVPHIERHSKRMRMLTFIVVVGGIGRLAGVITAGWPGTSMALALLMELVVTPLLCAWQHKVAKAHR